MKEGGGECIGGGAPLQYSYKSIRSAVLREMGETTWREMRTG